VITGDHECGGLTLGFSATGYETAFEILKYQEASYVEFTGKVAEWAAEGTMTFEDALEEVKNDFGLGDASLDPALELSDYEKGLLEDAFNRSMSGESTHAPEEISVIYGYYDPFTVTVTHILNNKAGIDWTSYSHTGVPVPVFAMGQGQYEFNGYYDNTDIAKKIIEIAELDK
jgi:alkaline phosphatase